MSFNNPLFFLFFIGFFFLYWMLSQKWQNYILLCAGYIFCSLWDWRASIWLGGCSIVAYGSAFLITQLSGAKGRLVVLTFGLFLCFGILLVFKYFSVLHCVAQSIFIKTDPHIASVAVPIGMSFFVFKATSYMFDVYRGVSCRQSLMAVFNYIAFFPELAAGPIDRAGRLIPQLKQKRFFDADCALDAIGQISWGLFKKVVVADALAVYVDSIYGNSAAVGPKLFIATYFFAFQLYYDFSGYSDVAIGCARLLGFSPVQNFAYPFFSRSISEFWSRWHISLTSWFRDYVYIPLGGSRCSKRRFRTNIILVFTLSGIWHGTGWTYITWGVLNGLFLLIFKKMEPSKTSRGNTSGGEQLIPRLTDIFLMTLVFHFVLFTWVFFRAESMEHALSIWASIIRQPLDFSLSIYKGALVPGFWIPLLTLIEWLTRWHEHPLASKQIPSQLRWGLCVLMVFIIVSFGRFNNVPFIYFKF